MHISKITAIGFLIYWIVYVIDKVIFKNTYQNIDYSSSLDLIIGIFMAGVESLIIGLSVVSLLKFLDKTKIDRK